MKKLAIFDFDGTILNSSDDVIECFNEALTVNGFDTLTDDEYLEKLGGNIDQTVSLILKDKNTIENMELIKNTYREIYNSSEKENTKPFEGVHETLKSLEEKGILLAIDSNRSTESIKYYVDEFFNDINFSDIRGHDFSNPAKPMACGVKKIMHKLKIPKEETIFIGDTMIDIKTAINGEIDFVLVGWGYGRDDAFKSDYPLKIIDDIKELPDIIL